MNAIWQTKRLEDVATLQRGFDLPVQNRVAGTFPLVSSSGISDTHHKSAVHGPGVVTGRSGSIGNVFFIEEDFWPLNTTLYVKDFHGNDPEFIAYLLRNFDLRRFAGGTGVPTLNRNSVHDKDVVIPPLSEQKRIVAILDEAFEGIDTAVANAEKNLSNARELFENYLNFAFTKKDEKWTAYTLKQIARDFGRGKSKHRPRNDPRLYGGPYPFIQTGAIRNCDHVLLESTQTYNDLGLAQSKLWPKGTICITIAANIAETGILGFDACFPDSVIGIVVDERKTTNDFVEYLLQSVKVQLKAQGKGSAQDNINLATFENRVFPFPPLDEQKRLVGNLNDLSESIQKLEIAYEQKICALHELKQTILQKAFAGELTGQSEIHVHEAAE